MKLMRKTLAVLSFIAPVAVFAQTATPNIDQRQANQERRIEQGVQSGSLTQREANRLERGENRIGRMEDRAKADGQVTPRERRRLERAENVESRRIAREKHDGQHDLNHDGRRDRPARRY